MKENNKFKNLTLTELVAMQKKLKAATIGLGIVMAVACIALIYFSINGGNFALIAVGITCPMTLLPSVVNLFQINAEIKLRNSKQS